MSGDKISFSIRIVDKDGDPLSGRDVTVRYLAMFLSTRQTSETDSDGWAHFETEEGDDTVAEVSVEYHWTSMPGMSRTITVNDDSFKVSDGDTFSYTVIDGEMNDQMN